MARELEQRTGRATELIQQVYLVLENLDFTDVEKETKSIQQQIENQLVPIADLLSDAKETDLVIVVWHNGIPSEKIKEAALLFSKNLKNQAASILQEQGRCLVLFWATHGSPPIEPLDSSIALPNFEKFDVDSLIEWLETKLKFQLRKQLISESEIRAYLEKIIKKIRTLEGRLPQTYEILKQSLEY